MYQKYDYHVYYTLSRTMLRTDVGQTQTGMLVSSRMRYLGGRG
ncbi:MAG: hypothetical protein ACLU4N_08090 [Butyricimonas faecihominis]